MRCAEGRMPAGSVPSAAPVPDLMSPRSSTRPSEPRLALKGAYVVEYLAHLLESGMLVKAVLAGRKTTFESET